MEFMKSSYILVGNMKDGDNLDGVNMSILNRT